jgi:hypothetical protein
MDRPPDAWVNFVGSAGGRQVARSFRWAAGVLGDARDRGGDKHAGGAEGGSLRPIASRLSDLVEIGASMVRDATVSWEASCPLCQVPGMSGIALTICAVCAKGHSAFGNGGASPTRR